jgi:hypothetical protein
MAQVEMFRKIYGVMLRTEHCSFLFADNFEASYEDAS